MTTFFDANQGVGTMLGLGFLNTWTFAAIAGQPEFYVSGLVWQDEPRSGNETSLPAAVWLFGGGVGLIAMFGGRRKRKQKSVWEVTQNA